MTKKDIDVDRLIEFVLSFGNVFLRAGAEINRTEDTITRIARAAGAEKCEAFAITSLLTVTLQIGNNSPITRTCRIENPNSDFNTIEKLNTLSRDFCSDKITFEYAEKKLEDVKKEFYSENHAVKKCIGAFLAASAFTVFFGGGFFDAAVSGAVAVFMILFMIYATKSLNLFAKYAVVSFLSGLLLSALCRAGLGFRLDKAMIGDIMIVIPGIMFGNSLRELFDGDTISGVLRLVQACLLAAVVASGFAFATLVTGGV